MKRLLLGIMILCLLLSCSSKQKDLPDHLRLNLGAEPSILNPLLTTDSTSSAITARVFNGLVQFNEDLDIEPDLAKSYTISDDGLVYLFFLRDDVTWHDGIPFSGEDVLFTFTTLLDPATNTVRRSNYMFEGKPAQFELLDPYTLKVTLPEPYAPFIEKMAMDIIPKHIYEGEDINRSIYNRKPIGTGPYKFKQWEPGQYVILEKNENYYHGTPKIDSIIYYIILDPQSALIGLKKQELDLNGIPPKDVEDIKSVPFLDVYSYYDLNYTYLGFNLKHPLLQDVLVRKAIAHAIDQELIVKGVLKGKGRPAHLPTSPLLWSFPEQEQDYVYDYNPDKSRAYLEQAGYRFNDTVGLYEKEGEPLSFTIITNQNNKERAQTAQLIQNFLKTVGIGVDIQLLEWSSLLKKINSDQDPKDFDAVILGWSLALDPDAYSTWHSSEYPSGFNFVGYDSSLVDDLLVAGRREVNQEKRKAIYTQLYTQIVNDLPYVFLYYPESSVGVHQRVKGLSKPGPGGLMNKIERIELTP